MAKVLVVVADGDERDLYIFALRFAGHEVSGADQLAEAYQLSKEVQPDLILMEARLLGVDEENRSPAHQKIMDLKFPMLYIVDKGAGLESMLRSKPGIDQFVYRTTSLDQLTKRVNSLLKKKGKRK
jgi:DNA-binding response OmpR family regulator